MEFNPLDPPRQFRVGKDGAVELSDCGSVHLDADEQVTFRAGDTAFDVTRKSFGYYAANSLNGTLPRQGLRPALCRNTEHDLLFLLLVETGKEADYRRYLSDEGMEHVRWLDEDA